MQRRLARTLAIAFLATSLAHVPARAAVGTVIDNGEIRVSQHGFRFGASQGRADVSPSFIVWQDRRGTSVAPSGNAIWSKTIGTRDEAPVTTLATRAAPPRISGSTVVWADSGPGGDLDIFMRELLPVGPITRITSDPADQMNPVIDGTIVAWEDFRNGPTSDIYRKDLSTNQETAVVTAAGNQAGASVSGTTVAWRDARRGTTFADVYVRTGTDPEVEVKQVLGQVSSVAGDGNVPGEVQVAIAGTRLLWNEVGDACSFNCDFPKILKTCVLPCSGAPTIVDSVTSVDDDDFNTISRLDLSGGRAAWTRVTNSLGGQVQHVFTKDLVAGGSPVQVDAAGGAVDARVDGTRVVWTQAGSGSEESDVYWDDVATGDPPRRANSLGLGEFGENLNPAADGNLVAYKAPGRTGSPPRYDTWVTELTTPRRYVQVTSVSGTGTDRPAVSGSRVVWDDPRNCPSIPDNISDPCWAHFDVFQRSPFDSGPEVQLSSPNSTGGPPDADGSLTAWTCPSRTEGTPDTPGSASGDICVHDGTTLSIFDVAAFKLDAASTVGSVVRISGSRVVWHEFFFDDPTSEARVHVLHVDLGTDTAVDEVVGDGLDTVVDGAPDLDISGTAVVWAGGGKIWRNTAVGCGVDPSCDNSAAAVTFETPATDHRLSQVSIDGTRVAWVDCDDLGIAGCDVYTRTIGEADSHLVTNGSASFVSSPFVDGDNIFWVYGERSGSDVYMETVTGPTGTGPDTSPPGPPTGVGLSEGSGSIALAWANPTSSDFSRVRILRKSGAIGPTSIDDTSAVVVYDGNGTSFMDTDVNPAIDYTYRLFAYDFEPNYSTPATASTVPDSDSGGGGGGGGGGGPVPSPTSTSAPTPEPTSSPTSPPPTVEEDPDGQPLTQTECDPATQTCGTTGNDTATVEEGSVATGGGSDTINVTTTTTTDSVSVDAGSGDDTIDVDVGAGSTDATVTIDAGAGDDVVTVSVPEGTTNVEIIVISGDGEDTIDLSQLAGCIPTGPSSCQTAEGVTVTVVTGADADTVTAPAPEGVTQIVVDLGAGNDVFRVISAPAARALANWLAQTLTVPGYEVAGGAGNDRLSGSSRRDAFTGGRGADVLLGLGGPDLLSGGGGPDDLRGGRGNDRLLGGLGIDTCRGGLGSDVLRGC